MKALTTKLKLFNGVEIPLIGLGTYKMTDEHEVYQAIITALQNGYRHIDTAQIYGNEELIGKAIKDSGVPRKEIFLTSKIWNANHKYDAALQEIDNILKRLDTDYLDLCLVSLTNCRSKWMFPCVRNSLWSKKNSSNWG
ncbi:aldo/keto reductase [Spiroplasma citri]|uniref:Putative aldo/keto reductase oxidoreductase protein n=1 Tax=Spiroplasma citri TaxID=2133 RepID=Q14LU6_SPICI|nr:aldo/keto reductase [Spiroplasma citri]CAK99534.1 putative aldo/keto reductase oxidoreductase protein [Spiroplasma citri]